MATYYCSPGGDDGTGDGSIGNPWATWQKLGNSLSAGDTGYVRGGTYTTFSASAQYQCRWHDLTGTYQNRIKIWAYPDETPIWDLDGCVVTGYQTACIQMNQCDYVWVKGLKIINFEQTANPRFNIGWNLTNSSYNRIENCCLDNIGGFGFCIAYEGYGYLDANVELSKYNFFLNCDAFSCADPNSTSQYENANGFNIMHNSTDPPPDNNAYAPYTTFRGCRAVYCSDDGWDLYGCDSYPIYIENCWGVYTGYDNTLTPYPHVTTSNGFKLGPNENDLTGIVMGKVVNCIAAENTGMGFDTNDNVGTTALWHFYNNFSYKNGFVGYMLGYWAHLPYVQRNNSAYKNSPPNNDIWSQLSGYLPALDNSTYNIWDSAGTGWNSRFSQNDSDYDSLTTSQLVGTRQSNGDLPIVTFGHLVVGSDLIDGGINVGYPYSGSAPDVGVYWDYTHDEPFSPVAISGKIHKFSTNG
jgi:hypothetical protein